MLHEMTDAGQFLDGTRTLEMTRRNYDRRKGRPQVLIPTQMARGEQSAVMLGLQMAAARGADATLLHVVPNVDVTDPVKEEAGSLHWLDAIGSLHRALQGGGRARLREQSLAVSRANLNAWLEQEIADPLSSTLNIRRECRAGDIAEEISRFAASDAVELVILTSELSRWGLPVMPALVHRLLQQIRKPVIVVRPDLSARAPGYGWLRAAT